MRGPDPLRLTLELHRTADATAAVDFELRPQRYAMRNTDGGVQTATIPWDDALMADLGALRLPNRDPEVIQRLGERLRGFLAPTRWDVMEGEIRKAVEESRPVWVTIRSDAPELYVLPWELLTIRATGQHIGGLPGVLVHYEWPETRRAPSVFPASGRVLLAWSGRVPAAEHEAALREAMAASQRAGSDRQAWELEIEPNASCGRLLQRIRAAVRDKRPFRVLHLLCHGAGAGTTFGLSLDGEEPGGPGAVVDAGRLRQLLDPHTGTLRLIVLAACDSGNVGVAGNKLGSVGQALHRAGFAAVIASRFPLSVTGSNRLVRALYPPLLSGRSTLGDAFLAARCDLAEDARHLDWASIQLYAPGHDDAKAPPRARARIARGTHPKLHATLSRFRDHLRGKRQQIELVGRYKSLHDVLQEIEEPFNTIVRDHRRVRAAPEAWDELRGPIDMIQLLVEDALRCLETERLRDEFAVLQDRLRLIAELLRSAGPDDTRLDTALHHVRRILTLEISSANNRLLVTARELGLGMVTAELSAALDHRRSGRGRRTTATVGELRRLAERLQELGVALEGLVHEHNQWQAISNELRLLADADLGRLDEIEPTWQLVHKSLKVVLSTHARWASVGWASAIDAAAEELDEALRAGGDGRRCVDAIRQLYRRSARRFGSVDKQLLHTCQELRRVSDALGSVLEVLDDR